MYIHMQVVQTIQEQRSAGASNLAAAHVAAQQQLAKLVSQQGWFLTPGAVSNGIDYVMVPVQFCLRKLAGIHAHT